MEVKILNNSMTISISINGSCTVTSVRHRMNALKSDIDSTIKQLKRINNGLSNINGPVNGNISSAINGINSRIRSEEEKREAIVEIDEKIDAFVEYAIATDRSVARNIHQNEKRFYKEYPWLKPDIIPQKNVWQNMLEGGKALLKKIGNGLKEIWKGVKEFVKEHALEIIIGTIGIIVAVVLTVLTGGTIWAAILVVFKSVVISMAVFAALSTGIALITGGDVKKAFLDGLASGYMWGGIFAAFSASVNFVKAWKNGKTIIQQPKTAETNNISNNTFVNQYSEDTLTKPSNSPNPNAKPTGKPAEFKPGMDEIDRRSLTMENDAADVIAQKGYNIEQNPKIDLPKNSDKLPKHPDYLIEGEYFDCYSPRSTTSENNIISKIFKKTSTASRTGTRQTERVIINLREWNGDVNSLTSSIRQSVSNGKLADPSVSLREVWAIIGDNIFQLFP